MHFTHFALTRIYEIYLQFGFAALIAGVSAVAVAENDLKSIDSTLYLYKGTLGAGAVINTFGTIAVVSQLAIVVLRLLNRCNSNINFFLTVVRS